MWYEVRRAEACQCGLVCPSRTSEREGEGYCVKGGWREGEERVRRSVNPIPNPDPGLCEELVFAQNDLIVGIGPPGVRFFHTGVRRRKYKLGQTKQILL